MTLDELLAVAEVVEKLTIRYRDQEAAHKAALTEIRASFNARTSADGKRYEGILDTYHRSALDTIDAALKREESTASVAKRLVEERDALRAEVAALQERLRASIARGDFAQMEVARLKPQIPKHPVKVGEWVRRTKLPGDQSPVGIVKQVTSIRCYGYSYGFADRDCWSSDNCEPCDPPEATHDTEAGKASAESALETETVAEEIKVGDLVEVFQATYPKTTRSDIGASGIVVKIVPESEFESEHVQIDSDGDPSSHLPFAGMASIHDVRKVTT